ncbi:hypothetical protein JYU34_016179 [Plutella xylostella]|uniref:Uncharacterized protein n=1 Tax=Plutella xylostella TaxID=51655 RepID=A0ABQ7Q5K8_PLUXY|nr:hypothetical protein JYU34_016179 [Plutella xylostella]
MPAVGSRTPLTAVACQCQRCQWCQRESLTPPSGTSPADGRGSHQMIRGCEN